MISAFGIEHGMIAKADALGTPESILGMEHMRGEHEGKSFRRCPKCNQGAFGYARRAMRAVEQAPKVIAR